MKINESDLDIVIPVYNEGETIIQVLRKIFDNVKTKINIYICYDRETDSTLSVLKEHPDVAKRILLLKNSGVGPHSAVMTGLYQSKAPAVLVFPADDDYNYNIIDAMYESFKNGNEIVAASRFMKGGSMKGCPFLKSLFVRLSSFTLYYFAFIPIKDASNGFRLFSRKVIDTIPIESDTGFTYSIEYLVKAHRLKYKISQVPAQWYERKEGKSNFKVIKWLPDYLTWYFYGFATTYFRKKDIRLKIL